MGVLSGLSKVFRALSCVQREGGGGRGGSGGGKWGVGGGGGGKARSSKWVNGWVGSFFGSSARVKRALNKTITIPNGSH